MALLSRKRSTAKPKTAENGGGAQKLLELPKALLQGGGERIILLIGDEGGVLVHLRKGKVVNRIFSPAADAPETQVMAEAARKASRAGISVVFDTVDQTYMQQTLPPVTALSVHKLMKRRMDRDFSADYIKGAFSVGRTKDGGKEWQFMIAALQQTSAVKAWLDAATQWPNPFRGIFLLPVESWDIFRRLVAALAKQGKPEAEASGGWQILVSYNKVSGVRQVVFKGGKLMLTRLGQPPLDATSESIAGAIEQEIAGTNDYLKHVEQGDAEKQHVIILAASDICKSIDIAKLRAERVDMLSPFEAAEMLHLEGAAQQSDRFGDSLLCAAFVTNPKRQLVLSVPEMQKQQMLSTAIYGQRALAGVAAIGLLGAMSNSLLGVYSLSDDVSQIRQKQAAEQQEFDRLKKKSQRSPEELDRIVSVVELYNNLDKQTYRPDSLLISLGQAFPQKDRLAAFSWQLHDAKPMQGKPPAVPVAAHKPKDPNAPMSESQLMVQFPDAVSNDRPKLQQETTDLLNQVKAKLPEFQVSYSALPSLLSNAENIEVNLGQQNAAAEQKKEQEAKHVVAQASMAIVGPANTGIDAGESNGKPAAGH